MARKSTPLITGNLYHVMSRGNNQQNIFIDTGDYYRFLRNLYEFNDKDVTVSATRIMMWRNPNVTGSDPVTFVRGKYKGHKRDLLVDILAFCLMPNHFHLLLRQETEGGISEFVKRIKGGFAAYWNTKHEQSGSLFQSHFKAVDIQTDEQLNTIFSYIHTNPCQLIEPEWKTLGLKNKKEALNKLNSYKWSSYLDYLNIKNFPSLTNRSLFTDFYGGAEGCKDAVENWIKFKSDSYEDIKDLILE